MRHSIGVLIGMLSICACGNQVDSSESAGLIESANLGKSIERDKAEVSELTGRIGDHAAPEPESQLEQREIESSDVQAMPEYSERHSTYNPELVKRLKAMIAAQGDGL